MEQEQQQAPAPATELGACASGARDAGVSLDWSAAAARKDGHSKICTAGGMRDRRMRLSVDVARKFFALQGMLGFDKASDTVEWLLGTSKAAIQEIMADNTASECVEDGSRSISVDGTEGRNGRSEGKKPAKARKAATKSKPPRKSGNKAHPVRDKETRAKARERARERTRVKRLMRWVKLASAIHVEAVAASVASDRPWSNNLNHHSSSSMNYHQEQWELGEVVFQRRTHHASTDEEHGSMH